MQAVFPPNPPPHVNSALLSLTTQPPSCAFCLSVTPPLFFISSKSARQLQSQGAGQERGACRRGCRKTPPPLQTQWPPGTGNPGALPPLHLKKSRSSSFKPFSSQEAASEMQVSHTSHDSIRIPDVGKQPSLVAGDDGSVSPRHLGSLESEKTADPCFLLIQMFPDWLCPFFQIQKSLAGPEENQSGTFPTMQIKAASSARSVVSTIGSTQQSAENLTLRQGVLPRAQDTRVYHTHPKSSKGATESGEAKRKCSEEVQTVIISPRQLWSFYSSFGIKFYASEEGAADHESLHHTEVFIFTGPLDSFPLKEHRCI